MLEDSRDEKDYVLMKKNELIKEVDSLIDELNKRDRFIRLWGRACCEKNQTINIWINGRRTKWGYSEVSRQESEVSHRHLSTTRRQEVPQANKTHGTSKIIKIDINGKQKTWKKQDSTESLVQQTELGL